MKRLDRYLLSGFFWAWLAATVFFAGMYLIVHFFNKLGDMDEATEAFRANGMDPVMGYARYYGSSLPFIMVETAPFTILLGGMWAVQLLARRNELVSAATTGVSLKRLALPLFIAGFIVALIYGGVRERVLPELARERQSLERMAKGSDQQVLRDLRFQTDSKGHLLHIHEYTPTTRRARGVYVFKEQGHDAGTGKPAFIQAMHYDDSQSRWVATGTIEGDSANLFLAATDLNPEDLEVESRSLAFLDVRDLQRLLQRSPERTDLRVLLHSHFAFPLAPLVLLLLGIPLVMRTDQRRTPYMAAGVGLLLSIAFFAAQNIMAEMGSRNELLNPVLGVWLPIVLFGSVGLILFETMST